MEGVNFQVLPLLGLIGGFVAGLLGLGGGVVMLPLLTFVGKVPLKLVTGTDLVHVLVAAAVAVVPHYRAKGVDTQLGLTLGSIGILGGVAGSFLSAYLSNWSLQVIYLCVVILATLLLFLPQHLENAGYAMGQMNLILGIPIGLAVGFLAGLLGTGGGFLIIPVMVYFLKIPLRVAIGTSLLSILVTSLGTIWAKLGVKQIDSSITLLVLVGSIGGAFLGARVSKKLPVKLLRLALISLLLVILISVGSKTLF